jgi:hypothetical protein
VGHKEYFHRLQNEDRCFQIKRQLYAYIPTVFTVSTWIFYLWVCMILSANRDYFLSSINQSIFVMANCCVLFEVWTGFLIGELRLQRVNVMAAHC